MNTPSSLLQLVEVDEVEITAPIHRTHNAETEMQGSGLHTRLPNRPTVSKTSGGTAKVQPSALDYLPMECLKLKQFEEDLYLHLKGRVEEVRLLLAEDRRRTEGPVPQHTVWNTNVAEKVRQELLLLLESFHYKVRPTSGENPEAEDFKNQSIIDLRNFKNAVASEVGFGRRFYGVPLKFNHLDAERIWKEVRDTEFYDRVVESTELVLSVAVFAYPACAVSVWVFVGSVAADIDAPNE